MISRQKIDTTTTRKEFIYRPYQGKRTSNHTRAPITMTLTTSSKRWELTPLPLLIRMLGYLDNATLMLMCLVCKQIRDLIWDGHGLEQKLIRVFDSSKQFPPEQLNGKLSPSTPPATPPPQGTSRIQD